MTSVGSLGTADLVVVGAGIVGLAHAYEALERGLSVVVVERDEHPVGASIRNFGHGCVTAQSGPALEYALAARTTWLRLAKEAGFWLRDSGTVVVARHADEYAVLEEFAAIRGDQVVPLSPREVTDRVPLSSGATGATGATAVTGGAWLPLDIRVDPREAVPAVARWLAERGVTFHWSTAAHTIESGAVGTSRGVLRARRIVVALGHHVDRHFPQLAEQAGVTRCALRMLRVANPYPQAIDPAVLTGYSLLRYDGFAGCPSLPAVRARLTAERPELVAIGLNLMLTQLPDGDLTIGDTHAYGRTLGPFADEELDRHVLTETAALLGAERLTVRERWRGVYASAPAPFLVATPAEGVRVVSVTSGIGMTTAFGLAPRVLTDLL